MDDLQTSADKNDLKSVVQFNKSEPIHFTNSFHSVKVLEELQSLRNNEELCDITLKTDNGTIVVGHKNVLVAASKYFRDMFSSVDKNINVIIIKDLDSSALQILIDYIYTGKIKVTNEHVKVLLPAANILQFDYVSSACVKYLQTHIDTSNCLSTKEFADLHKCTELIASSEAFINKHFLEIVKNDEFISLTCEKVIELISCNNIAVPSEEKVFECVINWIKHDLNSREKYLPQLMEHVRFPLLASNLMIFKNIIEEPLFKNCPKYNDIVSEVFNFYLLKSVQYFTIPQTIRCKPRQFGSSKKIILLFNHCIESFECSTEWFDPATNLRKTATKMNKCCVKPSVGVFRDQFVFAMGGMNKLCSQSVNMLDVSSLSPCWVPMTDMLVNRKNLGVGVLNDCIYAIGGFDNDESALSNVEVFDVSIQKWRMVTSMNTKRNDFGVGVLNDRLYAVGGYDGSHFLKSVECYDPTLNTWTPVAELSIRRNGVSIGVLNGFMYAVGGSNSDNVEGSDDFNGDGSDDGNGDSSDERNVDFTNKNCDILLNESLDSIDNSKSPDLLNKWKSERYESVHSIDLDDVMIAVGSMNGGSEGGNDDGSDGENDDNSDGHNNDGGSSYLRSVEVYKPSDGLWSSIADMNLGRYKPGVVALDGLLYVFGGVKESNYFTMEVYDPNTNTWSMKKLSKNDKNFQIYSGVVVNRPPNFTTE